MMARPTFSARFSFDWMTDSVCTENICTLFVQLLSSSSSVSTLLLLPFRLRVHSRSLCTHNINSTWKLNGNNYTHACYDVREMHDTIYTIYNVQCKCEWANERRRNDFMLYRVQLCAWQCAAMKSRENSIFHLDAMWNVQYAWVHIQSYSIQIIFTCERVAHDCCPQKTEHKHAHTHRQTYTSRVFRIRCLMDSWEENFDQLP